MNTLVIKERRIENIIVLDIEGNLRIGDGNVSFRAAIRQLLSEGQNNILLNLDGVRYIDSSGLGELIAGYTTIKNGGGHLKLLNLSEKVHELMTITKLLTVFDVYDNELEAIKSFGNNAPEIKESQIPTVEESNRKPDNNELWPRKAAQSRLP